MMRFYAIWDDFTVSYNIVDDIQLHFLADYMISDFDKECGTDFEGWVYDLSKSGLLYDITDDVTKRYYLTVRETEEG